MCFGGCGWGDLLAQRSMLCVVLGVQREKDAVLPALRELGCEGSLSTRQNTALRWLNDRAAHEGRRREFKWIIIIIIIIIIVICMQCAYCQEVDTVSLSCHRWGRQGSGKWGIPARTRAGLDPREAHGQDGFRTPCNLPWSSLCFQPETHPLSIHPSPAFWVPDVHRTLFQAVVSLTSGAHALLRDIERNWINKQVNEWRNEGQNFHSVFMRSLSAWRCWWFWSSLNSRIDF